jgi:hypothetical protein
VMVSTKYAQANFAGGTVDGFTSQSVVVPEPTTTAAAAVGLGIATWWLRRWGRPRG